VIGKTDAKHRNSQFRDCLAERDVLLRAGIPVREQHNRFWAALESRLAGK